MQLRIAVIQSRVTGNLNENINEITRLIQMASSKNADFIALPELWIHSSPTLFINKLADHYQSIIEKLASISKSLELAIVGGGLYVRENQHVRIACPVIDSSGGVLGCQYKVHLFNEERVLFKPGDKFDVFRVGGTNIGIAICHDIVYPESVRILALKGADIVINPSRIITEGIKPWHLYLMTRSLENRIPIVAPNIWIEKRFDGGSIIVKPVEKERGIFIPSINKLRNGSAVLIGKVDTEKLKKARTDRLMGRRPEVYCELIMNNHQGD
jgi:predicted amidohydrolase